jgi:hypothetical protein
MQRNLHRYSFGEIRHSLKVSRLSERRRKIAQVPAVGRRLAVSVPTANGQGPIQRRIGHRGTPPFTGNAPQNVKVVKTAKPKSSERFALLLGYDYALMAGKEGPLGSNLLSNIPSVALRYRNYFCRRNRCRSIS